MHVAECILSWAETTSFANFLNSWGNFQQNFIECFPSFHRDTGIRELSIFCRKVLLFYAVAPCVILTLSMTLGFGSDYRSVICIPYMINVGVNLIEDVKVFMTCKTIAISFEQIRGGVKLSTHTEMLTTHEVKRWRSLVLFVRQQVVAAGAYQKNHQLFIMIGSIIIMTCLSFVVLNATFDSPHAVGLKLLVTLFSIICAARVQAKILAAETITIQVNEAIDKTVNPPFSLPCRVFF